MKRLPKNPKCPRCSKRHPIGVCSRQPRSSRNGASRIPPAANTMVNTSVEPVPASEFSAGAVEHERSEVRPQRIEIESEALVWREPEPTYEYNAAPPHENVVIEAPETPRLRLDRDPSQPNGLRVSLTVDVDAGPAREELLSEAVERRPIPDPANDPLHRTDPRLLHPLDRMRLNPFDPLVAADPIDPEPPLGGGW